MGKTALCIQMLELLYSRDVVSIAELARALETNPRNIPEYKKELEQAGYVIETVSGRYGGYRLNKANLFPALGLDAAEREALLQGQEYLRARGDFMYSEAFSRAMAKVAAAVIHDNAEVRVTVSEYFPLSMSQAELERRYQTLDKCLRSRTVAEMTYTDLEGAVTKRHLHPYKLFMHHNSWYVLGFDEMDRDIRYFKLNRIRALTPTPRSFRVMFTYREQDYLDEFGMKRHGERYAVRLVLSGPYAIFAQERIYGKDQHVEALDGERVLLQCEMQNRERILQFVLGCGKHCRVLEPLWLRDAVCEAAAAVIDSYGASQPLENNDKI